MTDETTSQTAAPANLIAQKPPTVDGGAGLQADGKPFAPADSVALAASPTDSIDAPSLEQHHELADKVDEMEKALASLAGHATSQEHDSLEGVKHWYTKWLDRAKLLV